MTGESGVEQFILKFLHVRKSEGFVQKFKFSSKNDMLCAWRDFKKNVACVHTINDNFKPKISFIFHFDRVTDI